MALALKARRSSDPSHRQANADLTPQEARLASLMQRAAQLLSQGADSSALRTAIRQANIAQAMDALPWAEHDAQISEAVDTLSGALSDAGVRVGEGGLPSAMTAGFSFNRQDPRALAWAQAQAASLVREVSENTRQALRDIISDAFLKNLSVNDVISRIRSTVGLTEKGAQTVSRLQDRVFNELVASGTPALKAGEQALAQAIRMRSRLVKARAQTIARTEILRASNNGRYLGWTQAIESGFAPANVMKQWSSTTASLSGGACPRCRPMHGEIVAWDAPFTNGVNMPPAHPNCRCTALMVEPQPEQRKNPTEVTQETDYSTPAPLAVGVPKNPSKPNQNLSKPNMPDIGIPKDRRVGMGDIPIPAKDLATGSAAPYLRPDGTLTPERQALHDEIVSDALRGIRSVPKQSQPVFEMLGGGAGAGKSTVLKSGQVDVKTRTQAVHINADDIKELIPEVRDKIGKGETDWAAFGHEESSYLAKRILSASMEKRKNVVLDGTGDSGVDSVLSKIQNARRAGYKVKATYVTVDTDDAIERATSRAKATGRAVPTRIIRDTHASVSRIFPEIAGEFDDITLVSTNGPEPILVAKGVKGKPLSILNADEYDRFLGKSDPNFKPAPRPIPTKEPKAGATPVVATKRNAHIESQVAEWQKDFSDEEALRYALLRGEGSSVPSPIKKSLIKKYRAEGMDEYDAEAQATGEMLRARYYIQNRNAPATWEAQIERNKKYDPKWEKKIRANAKLAVEKLTDAAKNGRVTIAATPEAVLGIIKDGRFKNQFETNSSGGILNPTIRKIGEAGALEIRANAPATERPVYGFITTNEAPLVEWKQNTKVNDRWQNYLSINSDQVEQYGAVRITLKSDVRKRTTFTIGDSLRTGSLAESMDAEQHDFTNAGFYGKAVSIQTDGEPSFGYLEAQIHGGVDVKDIDTIYLPKDYTYRQKDYPAQLQKALADAGIDAKVVIREG